MAGLNIDLSELKSSLTSSAKNLESLSTDFISKAGSANLLNMGFPEAKDLADMLPGSVGSLQKAVGSVGKAILGDSVNALPKMQNMLSSITPNLGGVQDLCTGALNKISKGLVSVPPGINTILANIKKEAMAASTTAKAAIEKLTGGGVTVPTEVSNIFSEIGGITEKLRSYTGGIGAFIDNPSTALPTLSGMAEGLLFDQLLTTVGSTKSKSVDLVSGGLSSILYKAAGTIREASLRARNKQSIYISAQLEYAQTAETFTDEYGITINRIRSTSPEQSGMN